MANTEQDHTGGRPKALLEEGKLSTPHGRRRRGRVGDSRLTELGRSEPGVQRAGCSRSSDSGSSDDTEDEVKRRRRATARALVSLPHGKSVSVTASNLIRSTARTGDVKLKRPPDRCSAAVSRRLRPKLVQRGPLRNSPTPFRPIERSFSIAPSLARLRWSIPVKRWLARRSRSGMLNKHAPRFGRSSTRASCFCLNQHGACSLELAHPCSSATVWMLYWRTTSSVGFPTRLLLPTTPCTIPNRASSLNSQVSPPHSTAARRRAQLAFDSQPTRAGC